MQCTDNNNNINININNNKENNNNNDNNDSLGGSNPLVPSKGRPDPRSILH